MPKPRRNRRNRRNSAGPAPGARTSSGPRPSPGSKLGRRAERRALEAFERARAAHGAGRLGEAEQGYRSALEQAPNLLPALTHYAYLARSTGRLELALTLGARATSAAPRDADTWVLHANLCSETDRLEDAIAGYGRALEADPRHRAALYNLGVALARAGDPRASAAVLGQLVEVAPDDPDAWTRLAAVHLDEGKPEKAIDCAQRALALDGRSAPALNELGLALVDLGRFDDARRHYQAAIEAAPDFSPARVNLVQTKRYRARDPEDEAERRALARRLAEARDETARIDLHFALAKILDDMGDTAAAFGQYERGNALCRRRYPYDRGAAEQRAEAIMARFDRDFVAGLRERLRPPSPARRPQPVFIVGLPRSGTSLIEQVLAAHPEVSAAGELPDIELIMQRHHGRLLRHSGLDEAAGHALEDERSAYLDGLAALSPDTRWVTDKMPGNFRHLGLIASLFPDARIIHVRRNFVDTGLSLYFRRFSGTHRYAFTFDDIAHEMSLYQRLMAHWARELPPPVHPVDYERLIAAPAPTIRALLAFCDLPFDRRCLSPHEAPRSVHTASSWQVRQPLYRTSIGKSEAYQTELVPFRAALAREGLRDVREATGG